MNPNNNQSTPSASYLDQIAVKPAGKGQFLSDKKFLIISSLGILTIIFVIVMFIASLSSNSNVSIQLAARLNSAKDTVDSTKDKLKSSDLRAANSNLKLFLANTLRDYKPILAAKNVKIEKLDSKYTKLESNTELLARLEDARLNAVYDRTYAREIALLLEKTLIMMQDAYNQTSNKNTQGFLSNAYDNLLPIQEEFDSFSN